jgi:hypothetical protein
MAAAVAQLIAGPLLNKPRIVGKPLARAGRHRSARRVA